MELLTVAELAKRLKLARGTIYRLAKTDLSFPIPVKIGKSLRWDAKDIEIYIAKRKEESVCTIQGYYDDD